MNLYEDQIIVLNELRQAYRDKARAPLLCAATGFGKTVVFSKICSGASERGNRVLVLVHRQELVDQVSSTLAQFGVAHGIIAPGFAFAPHLSVQVASVFSAVRRMAQIAPPDLIIIDEAHHCILRSTWGKVIAHFNGARLLGVTATPSRLSGEGLGDIFDRLVLAPTVQTLIAAGRLSPVKVFAPPTIDTSGIGSSMGEFNKTQLSVRVDKPKITGSAVQHYKDITPGQRAAVFCVSIEHAQHVAAEARNEGITAVQIDGTMDRGLRRDVVKDFAAGHIQWLVTVDLISEGFDCPGIEVGISLRPTQSLGLWLQQCGRILRVAPGKSHATILDHAGNSLRHGLPTEARDWSLSGTVRKSQNAEQSKSVRVCPSCFAASRSGAILCSNCKKPFPIEARTIAKERGTLKEITQADIDRARERQGQGMTRDREALIALGTRKGYSSPERWADYVLAGRIAKRSRGKSNEN